MRIALDATYSTGANLTGVGVYSREILNGLCREEPTGRFDWFCRSQKFWRALREPAPENVTRRFLSDRWGNRDARLFHGLNQRLPAKRFARQIATFHDLFVLTGEYSSPEFRARFARQAREAAAAADLAIAVSAFTAGQVEALLNVPRSRIRVVHHGIAPRVLPPVSREPIVLCVGAIQKRKNQAALVRVIERMPRPWRLVLAGSSGYGAEEIAAGERVRITGYLSEPELAELYARASLFAFPSLDEGFGMPVLEAMQAGIPVVASNRSALPEVAGDAAVLVDPEDDDELASALIDLVENEKRREELAALGKIRASGFSWQKAVEQTLGVYRELLA